VITVGLAIDELVIALGVPVCPAIVTESPLDRPWAEDVVISVAAATEELVIVLVIAGEEPWPAMVTTSAENSPWLGAVMTLEPATEDEVMDLGLPVCPEIVTRSVEEKPCAPEVVTKVTPSPPGLESVMSAEISSEVGNPAITTVSPVVSSWFVEVVITGAVVAVAVRMVLVTPVCPAMTTESPLMNP